MRCYSCGAREGVTEQLKAVDLDGVAEVEARVRRCGTCGVESVGYDRMEELFESVARELISADRRLKPHELKWLRKQTEE